MYNVYVQYTRTLEHTQKELYEKNTAEGRAGGLSGDFSGLAADAREQAAEKAVEAWLAIHDAGRYDESWDAAAEYVKRMIPQSKWEDAMQAHRAPLGGVQSRSVHATTYAATLPGMPDGDYVVLQYKTSFEKKNSAIETIIPMLEDGQWKVMTYRIQ